MEFLGRLEQDRRTKGAWLRLWNEKQVMIDGVYRERVEHRLLVSRQERCEVILPVGNVEFNGHRIG